MRIKHIEVKNLFGVFDHSIPLNTDDRITIIYGPNGFGKTCTLSLINELFNPGYGDFFRIPFDEVTVEMENKSVLAVKKQETETGDRLFFEYNRPGAKTETFQFRDISEKVKKEPGWLSDIKNIVTICFIHTERLINIAEKDWSDITRTILKHSEDKKENIELLTGIVNNRFNHKQMKINSRDGIVFTTPFGKTLRPENLSSGEQHILLLLYRLLFKVKPDSLILIDEPELSLHILWQQVFLKDLEKIIRLAGVDILVATHSPQIIHDRWDLAVELKDPSA